MRPKHLRAVNCKLIKQLKDATSTLGYDTKSIVTHPSGTPLPPLPDTFLGCT